MLSAHYLDDILKFCIHWCAAVVSSTLNLKLGEFIFRYYFLSLFSLCAYHAVASESCRQSRTMFSAGCQACIMMVDF